MARDDVVPSANSSPGSGVYAGAVETEGLSIFDGSPRGGFEVRILGYDKAQVEVHIRQLEQALAYTRAMNRQLDRQIVQLRQRLGERGRLQLSESVLKPVSGKTAEPASETDSEPASERNSETASDTDSETARDKASE